jgi:hypothetical protein
MLQSAAGSRSTQALISSHSGDCWNWITYSAVSTDPCVLRWGGGWRNVARFFLPCWMKLIDVYAEPFTAYFLPSISFISGTTKRILTKFGIGASMLKVEGTFILIGETAWNSSALREVSHSWKHLYSLGCASLSIWWTFRDIQREGGSREFECLCIRKFLLQRQQLKEFIVSLLL